MSSDDLLPGDIVSIGKELLRICFLIKSSLYLRKFTLQATFITRPFLFIESNGPQVVPVTILWSHATSSSLRAPALLTRPC